MAKNQGGPAFARAEGECTIHSIPAQSGMTMRQYYKAAAITGLLCGGREIGIARAAALIADDAIAEDEEALGFLTS